MSGFFKSLLFVICCSCALLGANPTIKAVWAEQDVALDTNPSSPFWQGAIPVIMDADINGQPDPKHRTEIRIRWTNQNLYLFYICPYEELNLKPNPQVSVETNELWNWDVAEAFIGADFKNIVRYKEFEISPQGEWVDLDIDLAKPHHEDGWKWNSGMEVSARVDRATHVWYGAMKIPYSAIDSRRATAGNTLRINLFRSQGPVSSRHEMAWQPTMSKTFHVPQRFGLLELVKK